MPEILGQRFTRKELARSVGNLNQIAYMRPVEMREGRAGGLEAIEVDTGGGLRFTVLKGKCLDISGMSCNGVNLSYLTKPGLVAPEYFDPHGEEFLRFFQAGLLYTCGLSNVGAACVEEGVELNTHGRIGNTPAEVTGISSRWEGDECLMEIHGEMRESAMFLENLLLRRKIGTSIGSRRVAISDIVENQGFEERDLMILYHFNFGFPLLSDGARVALPSIDVEPRDEASEGGVGSCLDLTAPRDGLAEQVFYHRLAAGADGMTRVAILNDRLRIGVEISYDARALPRFNHWKCMRSGDYTLAFEPANCNVGGRAKERSRGGVQRIAPFEARAFDLELRALVGETEIAEAEARIRSLLASGGGQAE
jgi:hypothetical protein